MLTAYNPVAVLWDSPQWQVGPSRLKVGFHYPSSRAELTARELGCILFFDTRQLWPSTRVVETDH